MERPLRPGAGDSWFTARLRLEPVGTGKAPDLWRVHKEDEVSYWYGDGQPSLGQAEQWAKFMGDSWRLHGVHKWIAYNRDSGEVVGRGGLSRTPVDDDWGQIYAFLPAEPWVEVVGRNKSLLSELAFSGAAEPVATDQGAAAGEGTAKDGHRDDHPVYRFWHGHISTLIAAERPDADAEMIAHVLLGALHSEPILACLGAEGPARPAAAVRALACAVLDAPS